VSADGRQVAFLSATGGHTSIWSMNSDGTGLAMRAAYDPQRFPFALSALTWTPS
jgi:Tol biopolymer transport system component